MAANLPVSGALTTRDLLLRDPDTSANVSHTLFELPAGCYPIPRAQDKPPRHSITLHFEPDAPGTCLVCHEPATDITLLEVQLSAFDAVPTMFGPLMARLTGSKPLGYRFGPCGCEGRP